MNIKELQIADEHFSMIMIGKRRSGKSTLIRKLYIKKLKDKYDHVIVFSDTAKEEKSFWQV
jgi:predicted AAA+ superfamily ATPase